MANKKLPEGWESRVDPESGRTYFVDHTLKDTTWEKPVAGDAAQKRGGPAVPVTRVYFRHQGGREDWRQVRVVGTGRRRATGVCTAGRLTFWLFAFLAIVIWAVVLEVAQVEGNKWVASFGSEQYGGECSELFSDTWCNQYRLFSALGIVAAVLCSIAGVLLVSAFFCPRTRGVGYSSGVLLLLYAACHAGAIALAVKLKGSQRDELEEDDTSLTMDELDESYGIAFHAAIATCSLGLVDAIVLLALTGSAAVGPAYACLNTYGCCDAPVEDDSMDDEPPPYTP